MFSCNITSDSLGRPTDHAYWVLSQMMHAITLAIASLPLYLFPPQPHRTSSRISVFMLASKITSLIVGRGMFAPQGHLVYFPQHAVSRDSVHSMQIYTTISTFSDLLMSEISALHRCSNIVLVSILRHTGDRVGPKRYRRTVRLSIKNVFNS
jgi:hypothetical protein